MKLIYVNMLISFLLCTFLMESTSAEDEMRNTAGNCPIIGFYKKKIKSPEACQKKCQETTNCNNINYKSTGACVLRACPWKKEKLEKLSNAIKSTLTDPPSSRDTTSERSKIVQNLWNISRSQLSIFIERRTEQYKILEDLVFKIFAKPELEEYFPNFLPTFQSFILPIAIQNEDLNSPLLKLKFKTPFPKEVEDSAQLEDKEVTIDGTFVDQCMDKCPYNYKDGNWISTNLYAKQGQLVTVTVPKNVAGKFGIRVNAHTDDVHIKYMESWKKGETFKRPSSITQNYKKEIIKQKTRLLSPYGGLIFIDIGKPPINLGKLTLKFENVITSPKFKQGETTSEEWSKMLASSKSPMVELEVPGLIIIIPRSFVDENNLNIERVASTATKMMNAIHTLTGYVMPRPHLYVYDVAITFGGAHAGYPIMDRDYIGEMKQMENENPGNIGSMPHEIGHTLSWRLYTPSGLVEVIPDIFLQYVNEVVFKVNRKNLPSLKYAEEFKKGDKKFSSLDIAGKNNIFKMVAQECSWQTYIDFFKYYYEEIPTELIPKTDEEKYSLITRVLSEKCKKNLIPFFKWWNWPVLTDAVEATQALPIWEEIIDTLENAKKRNDAYTIRVKKGNFIKECWKERNTDTYGFDMESKEVKSKNECADWCVTTTGCTFWTWRKRDNFCWIKNGDLYAINRPGFISGSKMCASRETLKAIKVPEGGNWNLLFRQTINGEDDLFKKGEWSRNKENIDAPNFSRLEDFENFKRPDGTFHLFLWYPELGEGNEWTQTSNPVTKKKGGVDNYKAISISYNRTWWGGLEYSAYSPYGDKSLLDGSIGGFTKRHEWWYAIGAMKFESELEKGGGIRGPGIPVQTVELYIDY